jgi:AraC-like DNA-binding protein
VDTLLVGLVAALAGAGVAVVTLMLSQRRTRCQVDALMGRIDELEQRVPGGGAASGASPAAAESDLTAASSDDIEENLSRDVLAGRTSFVRRAVEGELSRPSSLAGQAIGLVHSRIQENLLPAELAAELAISLRTLERGLAAELGCSPRQLIVAMKMREARRLLESGRFRVNEVASRLGFATPSHFSRSFRAFYRLPPSTVARKARS